MPAAVVVVLVRSAVQHAATPSLRLFSAGAATGEMLKMAAMDEGIFSKDYKMESSNWVLL